MEKNLPDQDPFEEYVRRTFDELDEEPSAEMWSKIDAELRPTDRKPGGLALFFKQNRWLLAACLAGLLTGGVFGWQLGRFSDDENRGGSLVEKSTEKQPPRSSAQSDESVEYLSQKNDERPEAAGAAGLKLTQKSASKSMESAVPENSEASFSTANPTRPTTIFHSKTTAENPNPASIFENGKAEKAAGSIEIPSKNLQTGLSETQSQPVENPPGETETSQSNPILNRLSIFEKIDSKLGVAVFSSQKTAPVFVKIHPEMPAQKTHGWFATVWLMPVRTHEKSRGLARPTGPVLRPLFVNRPQKESFSAEIGLSSGKKWGNGFLMETGLGLRSERSRAAHQANFRFSESTAGQAGSRQFDYDLTTYGGSASVSYRVEEVNPGTQIGPTEEVGLQISTIEQVKTLRVPLLFGFQKQAGRWQIGLKTGPVAQFLLKNELEIESARSAHPRLRAIAGRSGWAISQQSPQRFRAGFQTAANVGFRVSEKIGLSVEPTFMGDFGSRVVSTGRLPDRFSTGLKLGATVWF